MGEKGGRSDCVLPGDNVLFLLQVAKASRLKDFRKTFFSTNSTERQSGIIKDRKPFLFRRLMKDLI